MGDKLAADRLEADNMMEVDIEDTDHHNRMVDMVCSLRHLVA